MAGRADAQGRFAGWIFAQCALGPSQSFIRTACEEVGPGNPVQRVEGQRVARTEPHDLFEMRDRRFWIAKEYADPPAEIPSWRMTWIEGACAIDEDEPGFQFATDVCQNPSAASKSD